MFKFTPRDNALFMSGMTFGAVVGLWGMVIALGGGRINKPNAEVVLYGTAVVMSLSLIIAFYINYKRFKKLK